MKKVIAVALLIISFVLFLSSCKSKQEKYDDYFQAGIEELTVDNFEKASKCFRKAKNTEVCQKFDEELESELNSWWNNYTDSEKFKFSIMTEEPQMMVDEIRQAFSAIIDGENEIYDIFVSNIHYHRGIHLIEEDRKANLLDAIEEFSNVLEIDINNYPTAQQEKTWLAQEQNRMFVNYTVEIDEAIEKGELSEAESILADAERIAGEDFSEQVEELREKIRIEKSKFEKKKQIIDERKRSIPAAEQAAMELNLATAGTILGNNFKQVVSANCVGYLLEENIFFVYVKHVNEMLGTPSFDWSIVAIQLMTLDNKIHYQLCGWDSQSFERTQAEFFEQLPSVIAEMSNETVLFDSSVFPDDLSFEYTEYARAIIGE